MTTDEFNLNYSISGVLIKCLFRKIQKKIRKINSKKIPKKKKKKDIEEINF